MARYILHTHTHTPQGSPGVDAVLFAIEELVTIKTASVMLSYKLLMVTHTPPPYTVAASQSAHVPEMGHQELKEYTTTTSQGVLT